MTPPVYAAMPSLNTSLGPRETVVEKMGLVETSDLGSGQELSRARTMQISNIADAISMTNVHT